MSRAINLDLSRDEVEAAALKRAAVISAIEPLFPRGTRVVLASSDAAALIRRALKEHVIDGRVQRTPLRTRAK